MMNPAAGAAATRSKIKVRFFLPDTGFRVEGRVEWSLRISLRGARNSGGGAGHELGGGGQQPLQQAHGAAADGRRRQLRAHQRLLRRHCGKNNSSPVLAVGIWDNFGSVYIGLDRH
jgi:hypothetical protein